MISFFVSLPLALKSVLVVLMAVTFTFPFVAYFGIITSQETINRAFTEKAVAISRGLDANVRNTTELSARDQLWDKIQKAIWLDPDILWIDVHQLVDGDLDLIVSTRGPRADHTVDAMNLRAIQSGDVAFEFVDSGAETLLKLAAPIHQGRRSIGTFEIWMTAESTKYRLIDAAVTVVSGYFALLAAFALVLLQILRVNVVRPVKRLTEVVREISAEEIVDNLAQGGTDEFSILSNAIDNMAETIENRNRELAAERKELEIVNQQLRENERTLVDALASAETSSRAKSDFLAAMSHELRTPLNAVIGFSEVLRAGRMGELNDEQKERLSYIRDAGNHLLSLIDEILDLSKIEAGGIEPQFARIDTNHELLRTVRFIENRAEHARIDVAVDLSDGVPDLNVDRRLFKQIFVNLLSNAVAFTPPGGHVYLTSSIEVGGLVRIDVKDTGFGMRPEDIAKAMEPFVQLETEMNRPRQGTGLGLYLVKTFVELHQGRVEIESDLGAGTLVKIWFPSERAFALES